MPADIPEIPEAGRIMNPRGKGLAEAEDLYVRNFTPENIYDLPLFNRDELLDVGTKRKFLRPGDMVEIS